MCNSNPLIWGKYCSIGISLERKTQWVYLQAMGNNTKKDISIEKSGDIRGSVRGRPSGACANNQCSNWGGFSAVHNVSLSRCFLAKLHVITWSTDQRMICTFPIFYWQKLVQCGHNSCNALLKLHRITQRITRFQSFTRYTILAGSVDSCLLSSDSSPPKELEPCLPPPSFLLRSFPHPPHTTLFLQEVMLHESYMRRGKHSKTWF